MRRRSRLSDNTFPLFIISSILVLKINAFESCTSLTSIILSNIIYIDHCCFKNCYGLSTITLPTTLSRIGGFVFENCFNLKEICLPDSVVEIGDQCFLNCTSLTSVTLSTALKEVDKLLFNKCGQLKEFSLGSEKLAIYPFKVSYHISKLLNDIGIFCTEVVLTRDDVEQYPLIKGICICVSELQQSKNDPSIKQLLFNTIN